MVGWYFDIVIGYLIRVVVRFFKMRRSGAWSIEKAVISTLTCPRVVYGGPYAELGYTYTHNGGYYAGIHCKPFMLRSSAEEYVAQRQVGEEIAVRVNPAQPVASIVAVDD